MTLAFVGAAPPAAADKHCGWATVGQTVKWQCTGSDTTADGGDQHSVWTPPTEWTETRYVPACGANDQPDTGADALCGAAVNTCPQAADIRFWVFTHTVYADPGKAPTPWHMEPGSVCRGPNDPTTEKPTITRQDVIDAAKASAPQATFSIQPADQSYVNVPNNFYAHAPDKTVTVTLFGTAIAVQFTAGKVTWDFGDGSSAEGVGIENAAVHQAGSVEHAYLTDGQYDVTVTTSYHVAFDLLGQHVEEDLVGATSDPQTLTIGEIQTLVEDAR
jgi:hypothetical protein